MTSGASALGYRPDIDGLRAVAVLSVLFYHAGLGFSGGYVGVDVFFVISGYLITRQVLHDLAAGTFSYADFWERRVRRLAPPLVVVTFVTAGLGYLILLPKDLEDLGGAIAAQPTMLSNVYFYKVVHFGYFGDPPETRPLLHTWSLGVEEQFYLLYPLFLGLIWRSERARASLRLLFVAVTLVSLTLCVALTTTYYVATFFNLPFRAWELMTGSLLAIVQRPLPRPKTLGGIGLGMVTYAILFFDDSTYFPGSAALLPCVGTALIIWSNTTAESPLKRALSVAPCVGVGRLSYSLYLWHWPIIASGMYIGWISSSASKVAAVVLSLVLGYLAWRWIEVPIKQRKVLKEKRAVVILFCSYALMAISLGLFYARSQGLPSRWSAEALACLSGYERPYVYDVDLDKPKSAPKFLGDLAQTTPTFILWGDSHAMSLAALLDVLGKENSLKGYQWTHAGLAPLVRWNGDQEGTPPEMMAKWSAAVTDEVASGKIRAVFLHSYWSKHAGPRFAEDLRETVVSLRAASKSVRIYIVLDVPILPVETSDLSNRTAALAIRWPGWIPLPQLPTREQHRERNLVVESALKDVKDPLCEIIDPAEIVMTWDKPAIGDKQLYFDDDHLSYDGALQLRPLFEKIFKQMR